MGLEPQVVVPETEPWIVPRFDAHAGRLALHSWDEPRDASASDCAASAGPASGSPLTVTLVVAPSATRRGER